MTLQIACFQGILTTWTPTACDVVCLTCMPEHFKGRPPSCSRCEGLISALSFYMCYTRAVQGRLMRATKQVEDMGHYKLAASLLFKFCI